MTRYEMAMVVARLLARIESIQIPSPAPAAPQVTRADLATLQRLVSEFRAELAALGVRVTALEEELNAIKAKLDNVKVTGAYRYRYDIQRAATGAPVNGNPTTGATDASRSPLLGFNRQTFKLSFDGAVTPDVHVIVAVLSNAGAAGGGQWQTLNSGAYGLASQAILASLDDAFFDWKNVFGAPLEIWLGRFGGTSPPGTTYPVQFGPFGLLMNTGGDTWEDSTADSGFNAVDGLRIAGHFEGLADLQVQALIARVAGGVGGTTYAYGEDAWGVDANVNVMEGLRVGGYYVANSILLPGAPVAGATNAYWHVYGPGGGAVLNVTWDLDALLHAGHGLTVQTGYLNFGRNFYPPYGAAEADIAMADVIYPGNAQAFTAMISFNPVSRWTIYGTWVGGNHISNGQSLTEYEAGAKYGLATNANVTFLVRDLRINNVEQLLLYRAELDYQF